MEKFMFIFKGGFYDDNGLTPEEAKAKTAKWYAWIQKLSEKNIYVSGEPLLKGGKAMNKKGGKILVTDGPFVESKELVAGYIVVKAKDYAEAAELAMDYPDFDLDGSLEIRQIMKIDM